MTEFNHQPPPGDVLDRAAAAARGQAIPDPPADLTAATLAAVHNRLLLAEAADVARRRRRRWAMRGISVGGLAACLAVAVTWGGGRADAAEALRTALDNQAKAKSFRAVIRTVVGGDGAAPTEQKLFGQGDKVRIEMGDTITVADGTAQKMIILDAKAKVARMADWLYPKGVGGHPDLPESVRKLLAKEGAEDLGKRFLDGRRVHGYRLKGLLLGEQKADVTYFVDGKRGLPARLEMSVVGLPMALTTTTDYLGFDEELDPKLFTLDIPDGYKREGLKLPASAKPMEPVPSPPAEQLAEKPKRERTRPVSLSVAAEAVAAAPCLVVINTQRTRVGGPELTVRMLVRGKKFRMEFLPPGGGDAAGALVIDPDKDQSLHLDFTAKTAKFEKRTGPKPATVPDLTEAFRQLKDEDGEPAGEEQVGDVMARVFRLKTGKFLGVSGPGVTTTVWLDPATSLPVKVRITDGSVDLRFDRFEWPATLDDRLFSLTPPKGYTVGEFVPPGAGKK